MQAEPTRYRVVVLTSCHCSESDSQPSIIVLMVKRISIVKLEARIILARKREMTTQEWWLENVPL